MPPNSCSARCNMHQELKTAASAAPMTGTKRNVGAHHQPLHAAGQPTRAGRSAVSGSFQRGSYLCGVRHLQVSSNRPWQWQ
jgi:hypothetical protein